MKSEMVKKMQSTFDDLAQTVPDEGIEFWFARDLQEPLGYVRWENFMTAINRAIESCETTRSDPNNHFRGVTKMVKLGSGAERAIEDFMLIVFRKICRLPSISAMLRSGSRTRRRFLSLMEAMQKGWLGRMGSEG